VNDRYALGSIELQITALETRSYPARRDPCLSHVPAPPHRSRGGPQPAANMAICQLYQHRSGFPHSAEVLTLRHAQFVTKTMLIFNQLKKCEPAGATIHEKIV